MASSFGMAVAASSELAVELVKAQKRDNSDDKVWVLQTTIQILECSVVHCVPNNSRGSNPLPTMIVAAC
jgi:hypothetical protein